MPTTSLVCPKCQAELAPTDVACPACGTVVALGEAMSAAGTLTASASASAPDSKTATDPAAVDQLLNPPEGADELGRLGNYRVLDRLGAGGMGLVFKAEDAQLRRLVALKVMLPAYAVGLAA